MTQATLIIGSKNYSAWSLRGWLMAKMSGIDFKEEAVHGDDPAHREELLLTSPSILTPRLIHDGIEVWDTLAIGEYLNELAPKAGILPKDRAQRAHCRSVSAEIHAGFAKLRTTCPMNLRSRRLTGYNPSVAAKSDIDRIMGIWHRCFEESGGPYLFGATPTMADAMYAPVVTRFLTYNAKIDRQSAAYCELIMAWPFMEEWIDGAQNEHEETVEFEPEF